VSPKGNLMTRSEVVSTVEQTDETCTNEQTSILLSSVKQRNTRVRYSNASDDLKKKLTHARELATPAFRDSLAVCENVARLIEMTVRTAQTPFAVNFRI
jgi:hypothetical protein